ncbi:hypothetical protein UCRPC4_g04344 [Phaeomoniella chlamydospora]|uniref:Uncharacterized protein n=1 Tax=Phaeomoniella chlamydospora TaxID=158046 RepID=A0A0G2EAB6_PHACM|nr:hypothetical protein UCRPC4_g04344 [Phaeomoniella chlamydospora]
MAEFASDFYDGILNFYYDDDDHNFSSLPFSMTQRPPIPQEVVRCPLSKAAHEGGHNICPIKEDGVWLCNMDPRSFVGEVNLGFTNAEALQYVRQEQPAMYERLFGGSQRSEINVLSEKPPTTTQKLRPSHLTGKRLRDIASGFEEQSAPEKEGKASIRSSKRSPSACANMSKSATYFKKVGSPKATRIPILRARKHNLTIPNAAMLDGSQNMSSQEDRRNRILHRAERIGFNSDSSRPRNTEINDTKSLNASINSLDEPLEDYHTCLSKPNSVYAHSETSTGNADTELMVKKRSEPNSKNYITQTSSANCPMNSSLKLVPSIDRTVTETFCKRDWHVHERNYMSDSRKTAIREGESCIQIDTNEPCPCIPVTEDITELHQPAYNHDEDSRFDTELEEDNDDHDDEEGTIHTPPETRYSQHPSTHQEQSPTESCRQSGLFTPSASCTRWA